MKNLNITSLIIFLIIFSSACKKDNICSTSSINGSNNPITGTWKINSFIASGNDITSQLSIYTFTNDGNGGLTITGDRNPYKCTWNMSGDNNSMYHISIMGCVKNSILWECQDDWDLTNHDTQHCYFSSHNPNHPATMTWIKV
jgi:hypothetical protein